MKKAMWRMGLVAAMALAGMSAQAQPCCAEAAAEADEALEQLMLLKMAKEMDLYSDEILEMLEGHAQYREIMNDINAEAADLKASLAAAIEAGNSSEISSAMTALMDLEKEKLAAQHGAIAEAGTLLDKVSLGKLYLLVSDLEGAKATFRRQLAGGAPCPMAAAAPCAAGAAPAAAAVAAAAPAAAADPADAVMAAVGKWTQGMIDQDLDAIMDVYADDFEHYEYGDKEGIADFISQAIDMGYLEGLEIEVEDAEVEFDGDEAIVYPVELMGAFGSVTFELVLQDIDGAYKITGLDASGL